MSHSPGFEELGIGVFVRTFEEVAPLREYLITNMPKRVRPPGEVSAYSNYGAALAGCIALLPDSLLRYRATSGKYTQNT